MGRLMVTATESKHKAGARRSKEQISNVVNDQ